MSLSLQKLLRRGISVALDEPALRVMFGHASGRALSALAKPVYEAIHNHFVFSGHELGATLQDSFVRALSAIDDELNGWRISNALRSKLNREYHARIRDVYLQAFVQEQALGDVEQQELCSAFAKTCVQLVRGKERILQASALAELDIAALFSEANDEDSGQLLIALIETDDNLAPIPETVKTFLLYRNLLGDAVMYFFREALRRDPRVARTLDALQAQGMWRDVKQLDEQLNTLQQQQQQAQQAMLAATQAQDTAQMNTLMTRINQLAEQLTSIESHNAQLQVFEQHFADWSSYLDLRLDDLQNSVLSGIERVRDDLSEGFGDVHKRLDRFEQLLQQLHVYGLSDKIKPEDEFSAYSPEFIQRIEQATNELTQTQHRAHAAIIKGSVLAASGDNQRAEQSLLDALQYAQSDSERALAHYNLFQVYLHREQYQQALASLNQAINIDQQYALWRTDRYQVERILGAGGMGCAFLERNWRAQQVVIKTLWKQDQAAAERFNQEALTMAKIAGQFVPDPQDFDYADPARRLRPYIVMDYIENALDGEAWLQQHGHLSIEQGLKVGHDIAHGLALAHQQNICHHDLKPANLLLRKTAQGISVNIIDFGLSSQVLGLQRQLGKSRLSGKSALVQQVFGSFDYAPPEQLGDTHYGQPGPHSDIYSLGKTLYRLLTGRSAANPHPRYLREHAQLHDLIFDCLLEDPKERPASAAEIAEQLQQILISLNPETELQTTADADKTWQQLTQAKVRIADLADQTPTTTPVPAPATPNQAKTLQERAAHALNQSIFFRDRLKTGRHGPTMAIIPAGSFVLGSPETEANWLERERQHEVHIKTPFAISRYAITFDDYDLFCQSSNRALADDSGWGRNKRPVIEVNCFEAMDYCAWLSEQSDHFYRLPSEAEWEYACRAGSSTAFHFATDNIRQAMHYNADGRAEKTLEVGQFEPNDWGLYDMHGNVFEWTGSLYSPMYDDSAQQVLDRSIAQDSQCVIRGGAWSNNAAQARAASRLRFTVSNRNYNLGLRLVRVL